MTHITIQIDDATATLLREKARQYGLDPQQFVQASIEDLIGQPDPAFDQAARRVLRKNEELYKRLS